MARSYIDRSECVVVVSIYSYARAPAAVRHTSNTRADRSSHATKSQLQVCYCAAGGARKEGPQHNKSSMWCLTSPPSSWVLLVALLCHPLLLRSAADVCPGEACWDTTFWRCSEHGVEPTALLQRTWVWAVRHGEAEHNLDPVHGWKLPDPTLTDRGWRQASAAGELLPYETTLAPARPAHCTYHVFGAAIAKQVVVLCRCTYGW